MKSLILVLLTVLPAGLCAAQTQPVADAAPGVAVVESSWRRRLMRNPALELDPLRALEDQDRQERYRNEVIRQNQIRAAAGKDQSREPSRNASGKLPPRPAAYPYQYIYKVRITNTGARKIRELVWEYVFVDSSTGTEVGRHTFTSRVDVRPGKSKTMYGHSTLPPVSSVDASRAGEEPEGQNSERVLIKAIFYDDKSLWVRAAE